MPARPSPRPYRTPALGLVHRVARDVRDAAGAAAISLGVFGLPVMLAAMQVELPPLELQAEAQSERAASFVMMMPPPPADDLADTDKARGEPQPEPVAEPEEEPVEDALADAEEPDADAEAEDAVAVADAAPEPDNTVADNTVAEDAVADDAVADNTEPPTTELPDPDLKLPDERIVMKADAPRPARPRFVALASTPERLARLEAVRGKAAERESSGRKGRGRKCQDASGAILSTKEGRYEVERELIDMYVKDLKLAQTLARVGWHRDDDGKIDGFKIWRISCGTVLHEAGFRNGDVVHTVNGKKVRTVIGAIAAYRKLKRKDHLRVDVTGRDGSRRMMRYEVIEG